MICSVKCPVTGPPDAILEVLYGASGVVRNTDGREETAKIGMKGEKNMPTNKVVFGTVLIDLTEDTVTQDKLVLGETAHAANGEPIVGALVTQTYRAGSGAPDDVLGVDGDLYFDMG